MSNTFYPLSHEEFLRLNSKLRDGELRVYLYLMTLNPFPNSVMEIDTARISEQLGLTRRTIQRSIKRLQELQLIEIEITKFKYKKVVHGSYSRLGSGDTNVANQNFGDLNVVISDTNVASGDLNVAISDTRIVSNDIRIADTPLETLPDKDFRLSHIIHTYLDFKKSLSEEERANFLNFCVEKTKNLKQEVNDIEAWLAHKNAAGQNRWEVYYQKFQQETQKQPQKVDKNAEARVETREAFKRWKEEIEQREREAREEGQKKLNNEQEVQISHGLPEIDQNNQSEVLIAQELPKIDQNIKNQQTTQQQDKNTEAQEAFKRWKEEVSRKEREAKEKWQTELNNEQTAENQQIIIDGSEKSSDMMSPENQSEDDGHD